MQGRILQRLLLSLILLLIAGGLMVVNFHMIAGPMSAMVGGDRLTGPFRIADVAAFVIVLVELSMALFLMDALRKTQNFSVIGTLPDKLRVRLAWVAGVQLLLLASIEAGLVYADEILLWHQGTTEAALGGAAMSGDDWTVVAAQMAFVFLVPLATPLVAYPLESILYGLRGKSPPANDAVSPAASERGQFQ